jgi:hypothetical protein
MFTLVNNQCLPVFTGIYWYLLVFTGIYWYLLAYNVKGGSYCRCSRAAEIGMLIEPASTIAVVLPVIARSSVKVKAGEHG